MIILELSYGESWIFDGYPNGYPVGYPKEILCRLMAFLMQTKNVGAQSKSIARMDRMGLEPMTLAEI